MPNSKLEGKTYSVPKQYHPFLGGTVTYPNLKMIKTRLNQAKKEGNIDEFNKKGGDNVLTWVEETLKTDRNAIYSVIYGETWNNVSPEKPRKKRVRRSRNKTTDLRPIK